MRALVLCFASAKGGSGKTVISASLSLFLGSLGKRVLLLDTDAATNGLTLFYLTRVIEAKRETAKMRPARAYGVFDIGGDFRTVPITENVDLIPASFVMGQTEGVSIEDFRTRLDAAIRSHGEAYDYIICDAQAGADLFALVAIEKADVVIVVSEYDPVSAEGVDRLRRHFPQLLEFDRTWILFNKVLPEFATELGEFLGVARYLTPVAWDAEVIRAFIRHQLALDLERGNAYTVSIVAVARTLFIELETEIDQWRTSRQSVLKRPLLEQIKVIETELEATERVIWELTTVRKRDQRYAVMVLGTVGSVLAIGGTAVVIATARASGQQFVTFVLTAALLGGLLALSMLLLPLLSVWISRREDGDRGALEGQLRELERRASELRAEHAKYRTLADADFEAFVRRSTSSHS
jgi:cellulose biosynthesis protein BcsQ